MKTHENKVVTDNLKSNQKRKRNLKIGLVTLFIFLLVIISTNIIFLEIITNTFVIFET